MNISRELNWIQGWCFEGAFEEEEESEEETGFIMLNLFSLKVPSRQTHKHKEKHREAKQNKFIPAHWAVPNLYPLKKLGTSPNYHMFSIPLLQAEKKEEGKQGASTKKRASAVQLRITKVIFKPFT